LRKRLKWKRPEQELYHRFERRSEPNSGAYWSQFVRFGYTAAELMLRLHPFDDAEFVFERKHDGFRALAHYDLLRRRGEPIF
jgi:hypothetical protein